MHQKKNVLALAIATVILGLTSCGMPRKPDEVRGDSVRPKFSEFVAALPNHALPLEIHCGLPDETPALVRYEKFKSFISKGVDRVFGTVGIANDKVALIIYGYNKDDIYPTVFSYDYSGKIIDSLDLILDPCGGADKNHIPNSYCMIEKDFSIILTDTVKLIHYQNSLNVDAYIVDSLRIEKLIWKVDNVGKFYKLK